MNMPAGGTQLGITVAAVDLDDKRIGRRCFSCRQARYRTGNGLSREQADNNAGDHDRLREHIFPIARSPD